MTPVPEQICPSPRELDDLELLLNGALAPITRFNEPGSPVTLTLPDGVTDVVRSWTLKGCRWRRSTPTAR